MAVKKLTYVIEVDTASGKVHIDGLTKGFVNAEVAASRLNKELTQTSVNAGQAASKMGLAGAVVTELGRTVSDANYGMMAMANNLQQLSTLFITLIATSGGLTAALGLMKTALFGPLGLILIFQTTITLIEGMSKAAKTTKGTTDQLKTSVDALKISTSSLNEEMRERLKISKDINDERAKELLAEKASLEVEKIRLELRAQNMPGGASGELASVLDQWYIERGLKPPDRSEANAAIKAAEDIQRAIDEIDKILFGPKEKPGKPEDGPAGPFTARVRTWADDVKDAEIMFEAFSRMGDEFVGQQIESELLLTKVATENAQERVRLSFWESDQKQQALMYIGEGIQSFGELLGRNTAEAKAIQSAGALISTFAAVTKALNTPELGLARIPYAIAVGAFGLAQVKKINEVRVPNAGGGRAGQAANLTTTQAPTFNIVGSSNASQLRDAVEGQLSRPVKAYVTTKDIRSNEELDRNTRRGATIG